MPSTRKLAFIALLACMPLAAMASPIRAQTALPAIEKQMTPEEFKAAGLDKLSAEELARLNAWLGRTITTETAKAAEDAKQKVEHESRGFFNFGRKNRSSPTSTANSAVSPRAGPTPSTTDRSGNRSTTPKWSYVPDESRGQDQAGDGRQQLVHVDRQVQQSCAGAQDQMTRSWPS